MAKALCAAVSDFCSATRNRGSLKEIHLVDINGEQTYETDQCFQKSQLFVKMTHPSAGTNTDARGNRTLSPLQSMPSHMNASTCDSFNSTSQPTATPYYRQKKECPICLDTLLAKRTISLKCGHQFCKECIGASPKAKKGCPICGVIGGQITGNQPKDGKMAHKIIYACLAGYGYCSTIAIDYSFPPGIQTVRRTS